VGNFLWGLLVGAVLASVVWILLALRKGGTVTLPGKKLKVDTLHEPKDRKG